MSLETTTRIMSGYVEALLGGGDFAHFFTDDVTWTTMESGEVLRGREVVRDLIVDLHTTTFDAQPELKTLATTDGSAFLEAVFVGRHTGVFADVQPTGAEVRVAYSVAYDVDEEGIRALRAYMPIRLIREQLLEAAAPA